MLMNLHISKTGQSVRERRDVYISFSAPNWSTVAFNQNVPITLFFNWLLKGQLPVSDGSRAFNPVGHELKHQDRRFFHVANADPSRTTVKKTIV